MHQDAVKTTTLNYICNRERKKAKCKRAPCDTASISKRTLAPIASPAPCINVHHSVSEVVVAPAYNP